MTREEFNNYVKTKGRMLFSIAFRVLRQQDEAEDAVQEVFIRMWKMGERLDEYSSLDALAVTMTKNYCIDQIRKNRKLFEDVTVIKDQQSGISTDGIIEDTESFVIIQKVISGLSEKYREMINLRDIEGLSYEDIAERTGQNINTIRVNLSRARAMVKQEYKKYFNEKRRN